MKPPKDPNSYMDEIKAAQAEGVANIDLDGIDLPAQVYREMEALRKAGKNEEAKELHISSVMDAAVAAEEKGFIAECVSAEKSRVGKKGGEKRGRQKTEVANSTKEWLYPLLAECEADFPPDRENRGWKTMRYMAVQKLKKENFEHERIELLTRSRIQAWIDGGRPKKYPS